MLYVIFIRLLMSLLNSCRLTGATEPQGPGGQLTPHFYEYVVHMLRLTPNFLSAVPTLTLHFSFLSAASADLWFVMYALMTTAVGCVAHR